jgi:hypothetical protein
MFGRAERRAHDHCHQRKRGEEQARHVTFIGRPAGTMSATVGRR